MCLLANTPFRLLQFEAISTRNGVAYPKKQSKYDSLLGVFVAVGIQASGMVLRPESHEAELRGMCSLRESRNELGGQP